MLQFYQFQYSFLMTPPLYNLLLMSPPPSPPPPSPPPPPPPPPALGCTQPRRVATMSVAKRVSEKFGCQLGQEVS